MVAGQMKLNGLLHFKYIFFDYHFRLAETEWSGYNFK